MNNLKRILFVVAIVAVIASCAVIAVGAEYTVDNYDSILEYYEPMFGYEKFDDKDVGAYTDGIINEWSSKQLTEIVADGDNKYLTFSTTEFPFYSSNLFLNMNADTSERMLLSFKVKGDRLTDEGNLPIVSVYIDDNTLDSVADAANAHKEGLCLLKLDFGTGEVKYYTNRLKDYLVIEGFTLSADTWYNVDIIYNVVDNGYSVSVTNSSDDTQRAFKDDIRTPMGYSTVENVRIGMTIDDIVGNAKGSLLSLDDVFAYSGSFYRNPVDKSAQTAAAFADFIKIIDNPEVDSDTKIAVLSVYDKIVNELGYIAETDEAKAYVATLRDYKAMLYVGYVAGCTDFIDANGDYATRRANLDSVKEFYDAIPADYSFLSEELKARLESVKASYEAESTWLSEVEADCEAFLSVYSGFDIKELNYEDYPLVNGIYENVINLSKIDFTYPGMAEYNDSYGRVISSHDKIAESGDAFIENIEEFLAAETFEDKYLYYRNAADIKDEYLNDSYPGVSDALAALNTFTETTDILKFEADCTAFIQSVNRANYALYLSEKSRHLDIAAPYLATTYTFGDDYVLECVDDCVEGVAAAKVLYSEVEAYIANATDAATKYIQAVIALEGLSGSELEAAVNNAAILKASGDVEGFELVVGDVTYKMTDINITFSSISTELSLAKGYCTQFITYVNMIGKANTITERYLYIRRALAAKSNADVNFAGVSEAIELLDAEIAAYRSDISDANDSVSGGSAADSSSAVRARAKTTGTRVVAFVGKYGKED